MKDSKDDKLSIITLTFDVSGEQIMPDAEDHVKEIGANSSVIKLDLIINASKLIDEAT